MPWTPRPALSLEGSRGNGEMGSAGSPASTPVIYVLHHVPLLPLRLRSVAPSSLHRLRPWGCLLTGGLPMGAADHSGASTETRPR